MPVKTCCLADVFGFQEPVLPQPLADGLAFQMLITVNDLVLKPAPFPHSLPHSLLHSGKWVLLFNMCFKTSILASD